MEEFVKIARREKQDLTANGIVRKRAVREVVSDQLVIHQLKKVSSIFT